jgi:hypothetical protein
MTAKYKAQAPTESQLQMALVHWCKLCNLPIMHIPNEGKRSVSEGRLMKELGLLPGAADLFLARPRRGYAGFWIEMKAPGKKPTTNQYEFLLKMEQEGYKAAWFDDWEKAKEAIEHYLF